MEEITFLDNNPDFNFDSNRTNDAMAAGWGDAIERWFDPGIAEQGQFAKENYFVDKANAFNEYMYNKQNEYNTPSAQMERMKEAGINPLLAAGAIAGNGSTAAQAAPAAQGSGGMNPQNINPIEQFTNLTKGLTTLAQGGNEAGKLLGFGKENKETIKMLEATATKAAEDADFTYWQKRQFRRTMRIMYEQAEKNLEQTEAAIKNLQKTYENLQQEKYNLAADTNLKVAETGQTLETTKNIAYKNAEEQFKKCFRDLYGVQLNESDMSMLVQAIMGEHGDKIINSITDGFSKIIKGAKKGVEDNILDWINPLGPKGKKITEIMAKEFFKRAPEKTKKSILLKYGVPIAAIKYLLNQ